MMKIDETSRLIVVVWNMKQSWSIIKPDRTCCWMPLFNHSGGLALDQGSWMKRSGWAESSRNTNKKWLRRRFRHAKQRRETQLWQLLLMRFVGAGGWFMMIQWHLFLNGTYNDIYLYTIIYVSLMTQVIHKSTRGPADYGGPENNNDPA